MQTLLKYLTTTLLFAVFLPWTITAAEAQTLSTHSSLASYNTALPSTGISSNLEDFSTVGSNFSMSQTSGDAWNGFSVVASSAGSFGASGYCPQLNDPFGSFPTPCLDYNAFAPAVPGIVGAFSNAGAGSAQMVFTPIGKTIGFALDYVDWNDENGTTNVERSAIRVFLSNGATIDIAGPAVSTNASPGFLGMVVDSSLIDAGVHISSILWYGLEDELVGIYNVRTTQGIPVISVEKDSAAWDPVGTGKFSIPGNEIFYTISIENSGNDSTDSNSLFIVDNLPGDVEFWNGDIDDGGSETFPDVAPVGFEQVTGSGVTFNPATHLRYSTSSLAPSDFDDCVTIPLDSSYRSDIRYICINPSGALDHGSTSPQIDFVFRVRIK